MISTYLSASRPVSEMSKNQNLLFGGLAFLTGLLTLMMIRLQISSFMLLLSLIIFATTSYNIYIGFLLWLIPTILSSIINEYLLNVPLIFNPAFVLGASVYQFLTKKLMLKDKSILVFFSLTAIWVLLLSLNNGYYGSINAVANFVLILIICYFVINLLIRNYLPLILKLPVCVLISGYIALIMAYSGEIDANRLAISDSVRQLANVLSFASAVTLLVIISYGQKYISRVKTFVYYFLTIPIVFSLFITVSRGAIIASMAAVTISYLFSIYKNQKKITKIIPTLMLISIPLIAITQLNLDMFQRYFNNLSYRFQAENLEFGTEIRQYIWKNVIFNLDNSELMLGLGIGGFRYKSSILNIYYYSHSVFVDFLVTCGLLFFIPFIIFLLGTLIRGLKQMNHFCIGLMAFIVLCFVSHGSITSLIFWLGFSIARASTLAYQQNLK